MFDHLACLIILVGVPYTFFLFFWQWLIQIPDRRFFRWTENTRLNAIITTYHAPYNCKHRYWTGLLLVVRVVLYITAAVTESRYPELPLLITLLLVGGLLFLKGISGIRLYKNMLVDIMEMVSLLNLLALTAGSLFNFKADNTKQTAIAYVSTTIIFIMFVGCIVFHINLLIKKQRTEAEDLIPLIPPVDNPPQAEVTYSTVELPRAQYESLDDSEANFNQSSEDSNLRSEVAPCEYHSDEEDPKGEGDS